MLDVQTASFSFILGYGWRRASVVRVPVFGWRTFHDLRLING